VVEPPLTTPPLGRSGRFIALGDACGAVGSTACAIHCAAAPLLMAVLPLFGLEVLLHPACEVGLVLLTALLATATLGVAYARRHRKPHALVALAGGLGLLWLGHFAVSEGHEPFVSAAGALLVALSHAVNRRLCSSCTVRCQRHHIGARPGP